MPEYSTPKVTPTETTKIPGMNGNSSGYIDAKDLLDIIRATFGQANGVATLGSDGKLTSSQLPDLADDVIVATSYATLPSPGISGKLYITADNNKMYRWDDTLSTPDYVELSVDLSAYATKADLQDGTLEPLISTKARQDQYGNVIDLTYATKAEANDLKNAIDSNTARIENLEQEHGGYTVVNYRGTNAVPTGKAEYALVESIVGKSRAWNQLIQNDDSKWNGLTSYDSTTQTGTMVVTSISARCWYMQPSMQGHSYLVCGTFTSTVAGQLMCEMSRGWVSASITISANTPTICAFILSPTADSDTYDRTPAFYINGESSYTLTMEKVLCRDLTLIFPEGVPSTVAECVQKCPDILKYDAYGQSIVDTTVEGVVSFLCTDYWHGTTEAGYISISTGLNAGDGNTAYKRCAGYVDVEPDTEYNLCFPANGGILLFYGSDKSYLGYVDGSTQPRMNPPSTSYQFKTASNVYYVRFWFNSSPNAGDLTMGSKQTLSLPSSVTLRSAGDVAEVYDLETGEKTNPISDTAVNLASLSWTLDGNRWWASAPADIKIPASNNDVADILCAEFVAHSVNDMYVNGGTGIGVASNGRFYCHNGSTTTPPTGTVIYALATPNAPTQLTPVIDNTIQTEGGGTINTIQTQTPVIDNSMDVGYLAL